MNIKENETIHYDLSEAKTKNYRKKEKKHVSYRWWK